MSRHTKLMQRVTKRPQSASAKLTRTSMLQLLHEDPRAKPALQSIVAGEHLSHDFNNEQKEEATDPLLDWCTKITADNQSPEEVQIHFQRRELPGKKRINAFVYAIPVHCVDHQSVFDPYSIRVVSHVSRLLTFHETIEGA